MHVKLNDRRPTYVYVHIRHVVVVLIFRIVSLSPSPSLPLSLLGNGTIDELDGKGKKKKQHTAQGNPNSPEWNVRLVTQKISHVAQQKQKKKKKEKEEEELNESGFIFRLSL